MIYILTGERSSTQQPAASADHTELLEAKNEIIAGLKREVTTMNRENELLREKIAVLEGAGVVIRPDHHKKNTESAG